MMHNPRSEQNMTPDERIRMIGPGQQRVPEHGIRAFKRVYNDPRTGKSVEVTIIDEVVPMDSVVRVLNDPKTEDLMADLTARP
jgi:hypothetical protein